MQGERCNERANLKIHERKILQCWRSRRAVKAARPLPITVSEEEQRAAPERNELLMPTLALSMIVKNAAQDLADCIGSVRGVAQQIVVADTGSTDNSVALARELGAEVISIPWNNDFAEARNLSLAQVTTDWVLMLDADERLDASASDFLVAHMDDKRIAGYQVTIRNYVLSLASTVWDRSAVPNDSAYAPARRFPGYVDHENVRLFRRHPDIYFTGRVHETVGWKIQEIGREIGHSRLIIHHMGMVRDVQERARKIQFYRDLGKQKVADMPENAQAHFELGVAELENFGNVQAALGSIETACRLNPKFAVAWFFAGVCHFRLGEFPKALECFEKSERHGNTTALAAEMAGDTLYNLREYESAAARYRRGLKRTLDSTSLESKLGVAEVRSGNERSGIRLIRQAIKKQPSNPDLHDRLILAEVWLKHLPNAADAAEKKLTETSPRPEDFLRAASICMQMKDCFRAAQILTKGLASFPESDPLKTNLFKIETLLQSAKHGLAEKAAR